MLRLQPIALYLKRWKHGKNHWSNLLKKKLPKDRALENFDDFYGSVFGPRWKSIRVAMLTKHKYIAMVNIFGESDEIVQKLESEGAINLKSLVDLAQNRFLAEVSNNLGSHSTILDHKLEDIIKKQEVREIDSIYPSPKSSEEQQHETALLAESSDNSVQHVERSAIYKKPLEQAIAEDIQIDYRRLVDVNQNNTGGMYEFVPVTKIKGMEDWIPESDHYKYYSTTSDFPISIELEKKFIFPENLLLYTYEKSNCSEFIRPRKCENGVQSHFLMDGASILPPLLLNLQQGDLVLDACAAPGGKSLLMMQTLYPQLLICNDIQESRVNRIQSVMNQFLPDYRDKWDGKHVILQQSDARNIDDYEKFDKILVDVPCSTDRHCLMENDNNIFKPTRVKERLKIPEMQSAILLNCLRLLKQGGSLIYSTCSLSPIQNDGVVHMALQKLFNEHGITATINDLSLVIKLFSDVFKFENSKNLKYGQLVLPFLLANFGPMYFCKITRN